MTDKRREQIAKTFRRILDSGILKKNAIEKMRDKFGVSRRSLYRYCKNFKVGVR